MPRGTKILRGDEFLKALEESGLLPEYTVAVTISASVDDPVTITYTILGEKEWLDFASKQREAENETEGYVNKESGD
jgi:hypothetical protein